MLSIDSVTQQSNTTGDILVASVDSSGMAINFTPDPSGDNNWAPNANSSIVYTFTSTNSGGGDTTPPTFDVTPVTANVGSSVLNLNASLDENGTIYYVVVANGSTAPTSSEVKAGVNYTGGTIVASANSATSGASFDGNFTISGLTANTDYDMYVTAQDDEATPNLMSDGNVSKVDVTTSTASTLQLYQLVI